MALSGLSDICQRSGLSVRRTVCFLSALAVFSFFGCGSKPSAEKEIVEDNLVRYPGRTFNYKLKFNDLQSKQHAVASAIGLPRPPKKRADAASMRKRLV